MGGGAGIPQQGSLATHQCGLLAAVWLQGSLLVVAVTGAKLIKMEVGGGTQQPSNPAIPHKEALVVERLFEATHLEIRLAGCLGLVTI